jgi:hypothetical protein
MAVRAKIGLSGNGFIEGKPKKSRQGSGKHTKYAATSRNGKQKRYRGQGRWWHVGYIRMDIQNLINVVKMF